ncbi:MAG TPA: hypothetical protein VH500_07420 [Nitrososphaeraceae archaeon]|jgi:hypothetical protein
MKTIIPPPHMILNTKGGKAQTRHESYVSRYEPTIYSDNTM